ncbi:hypothetical protein D3C83_54070 [compost metagenome]
MSLPARQIFGFWCVDSEACFSILVETFEICEPVSSNLDIRLNFGPDIPINWFCKPHLLLSAVVPVIE